MPIPKWQLTSTPHHSMAQTTAATGLWSTLKLCQRSKTRQGGWFFWRKNLLTLLAIKSSRRKQVQFCKRQSDEKSNSIWVKIVIQSLRIKQPILSSLNIPWSVNQGIRTVILIVIGLNGFNVMEFKPLYWRSLFKKFKNNQYISNRNKSGINEKMKRFQRRIRDFF